MNFSSILKGIHICVLIVLVSCFPKKEEPIDPEGLTRSTPEAEGVSPEVLMAMIDSLNADSTEMHTMMIVRHGKVILEADWTPYKLNFKRQLYSLSKSFTSTAIGFAVQEGMFKVDDPVNSFFPDKRPVDMSENQKLLTIEHLLTMSTGHDGDPFDTLLTAKSDWVTTYLAQPIIYKPGSKFHYSTAATFMLSAILQKVSGQTVEEFLKPRFFEPLGIKETEWLTNEEGINVGGYGLRVKTEDIAKLGQFYLQQGEWNGKQLLNKEWIAEATKAQISNAKDSTETGDWSQGYGYQFWRNTADGYRGDGAYGQYCLVLPKYDAVVAITSQTVKMDETLNLVWKHLLPAFKDEPLELDEDVHFTFTEKVRRLKYISSKSRTLTPLAFDVSDNVYQLDDNEFGAQSIGFHFDTNVCSVTLKENGDSIVQFDAGFNNWVKNVENRKENANSIFPVPGRVQFPSHMAASMTWLSDNKIAFEIRYTETCHTDSWTCEFKDGEILLEFDVSPYSYGDPETRASIVGKLIKS